MKEYLKCKACGYVMKKDNAPEVCPACGLSKKVFEEYKYNISQRRKFITDMDLHPIILHIPQAISIMIPLFGILSLITDAGLGIKFLYAVEIIACLFPLSVFAAILSGLLDGKTRFKKISTPALKKKIALASILLIISLAMPCLVFSMGIKEALLPLIGLSAVSLADEIILAKIGVKLMFAYLPG